MTFYDFIKVVTKVAKQIEYGSSDLSKKVIEFRKANNMFTGRNVAVFEYISAEGTLVTITKASDRGAGHAERLIAKELDEMGIPPENVKSIYSELEPCNVPGGYCKEYIKRTYPQADVTYSFEYGDTVASRRAGVNTLKDTVGKIK